MYTNNLMDNESKPVDPEAVARMVAIANVMRSLIDCTHLVMLATGEEEVARWEDEVLGRRQRGGPAAG